MPNDDDYDRAPTVIKWMVGAAVAIALGGVAILALTPQAYASDVAQIVDGTYLLHCDAIEKNIRLAPANEK